MTVPEDQVKRWRDWNVRWISGLAMVALFVVYLYVGRQLGVALLVFVMQSLIYRELVAVAVVASKEQQMPGFKLFYYWWFAVVTYFMYTRTLGPHILAVLDGSTTPNVASGDEEDGALAGVAAAAVGGGSGAPTLLAGLAARVVRFLVLRCSPIAFAAYFASLIAFVLSLRKRKHFRYQFSQFAYTHMALLAVVVQSTFLVASSLQGLIWFVLPCSLVIANDSFAYVFGFLFGRTPLIRLSPKKTVEGFIGGAAATFVMGWLLTRLFTRLELWDVKYLMVCPATVRMGTVINKCDIATAAGGIFAPHPLSDWWFGTLLPASIAALPVTEMQVHTAVLAALASAVAPFGGFFASGFKRAQNIKDFGSAIPGHGGFTDRMDCQLVMGALAYMYLHYGLRVGTGAGTAAFFTARILRTLPLPDVAHVVKTLACHLAARGVDVAALVAAATQTAATGGTTAC